MDGAAVYTLKDGRAQVLLEAAGKYRFIKEFIKVRDREILSCWNVDKRRDPSGHQAAH